MTMNIRTIIFPTDLSSHANAAWQLAASLARDSGASVLILHVQQGSVAPNAAIVGAVAEPHQELDRQLEQTGRGEQEFRVERHVVNGDPVASIVKVAEERRADLIVMATHGRSGITRWLMGSVAEAVMRLAPCPVLTVKTPKATEVGGSIEAMNASASNSPADCESSPSDSLTPPTWPATEKHESQAEGEFDLSSERDREQALNETLNRLQAVVQATPTLDKLPKWTPTVRDALMQLEPHLRDEFDENHKKMYANIKEEDADLFVRVEELKQIDADLFERFGALRERSEGLIREASDSDAIEPGLEEQANRLAKESVTLVVDIRQHEKEVTHWLVEAFHRDRGAVD